MSSILSLYFDGAVVQALKVRVTRSSVAVDDARTFQFEDLPDFLSTCTYKRCILSCNPQNFHQDIFRLPPSAGKHYSSLVANEIKKSHPGLAAFSFFYHTVGEVTVETKVYAKVAAFSYHNDFLTRFISILNSFNISIIHIYSAPYSIARLALSVCDSNREETRIFTASIPGETMLIVCENSELEFIRRIPSSDNVPNADDIYNINMTVDYCFQTLRIKPMETIFINMPDVEAGSLDTISVRHRSSLPHSLSTLSPEIATYYLAPFAAAIHYMEAPRSGDITPSDYLSYKLHRKLLKSSTMAVIVLLMIFTTLLIMGQATVNRLQNRIKTLKVELKSGPDELAAFKKLDSEVEKLKQPLDFVNRQSTAFNPAVTLAALNIPFSQDRIIKSITVQNDSTGATVHISGSVIGVGYSDTQAAFEKFVTLISALPGYSITASNIDIKQKTFSVQAQFKNVKGQRR